MRIFIVAGGTGGHLFPAIRLTEEFMLLHLGELIFITSSRRQDRYILKERGITFRTLPVIGFQSSKVWHVVDFMARLACGMLKAILLLLRFKPSVVIGFGGYISGPVVLLATFLRIKTIIHEQNVYPGKANRILSCFVDRIAISFPETGNYFREFESKIVLSGNPLRRGLERVHRDTGAFVVLVMGGSQGAHALNKIVPEAVGAIEDDKKKDLEVIHISGDRDRDEVGKLYENKGVKSRVFGFINEMEKLYSETDFVIARAGATTVSELLYLAKPSVLIPYPYGNAHQRLNAKVLEDIGLGILLEESTLTAKTLRDIIIKLMDRDVLRSMSGKVKERNDRDACEILIDVLQTT